MVSAPGWYDSAFVLPDQVFARGNKTPEIYIDPKSDAHVGAFVLGEGSLKDWQELVAKPSRQSSCLRLSIAAALGATFLRPLGLDSFGINWFSDTSDGKTPCIVSCRVGRRSMGPDGLPASGRFRAGASKPYARGRRDCLSWRSTRRRRRTPRCAWKKGSNASVPDSEKSPSEAVQGLRAQQRAGNQRIPNNCSQLQRESVRADSARLPVEGRLGGEEVRLMDIPASDPNSSGIFDGNIGPVPGEDAPRDHQRIRRDPQGQCDQAPGLCLSGAPGKIRK